MSDLYLFAKVNFVPGQYDDWQAEYDKLAEYVWSEEQITKTYCFGIPFDYANDVSNTTLMFAFEIYEDMSALIDIHLKSPAMSTFLGTALPRMTTGLDLAYYSFAAGFLDLPGDARECGVMYDMRIHCATAKARDIVEKALREQVGPAVSREGGDGDGVYTWLVCRSSDDDKEVRIYSRFRSGEDLEKYQRMPEVKAFWKEHGQKEVATMEQRGYVPNHKGWLHR